MVVNVNKVEPEKVFVPSTTHSPNSELPVLAYRNALTDKTLEGSLAAVEPTGWIKGGHWKIAGVVDAATPHFHSTTHECYTVLRGRGTYLLGKSPLDPDVDENGQSVGVSFTASAGDIFAFPV